MRNSGAASRLDDEGLQLRAGAAQGDHRRVGGALEAGAVLGELEQPALPAGEGVEDGDAADEAAIEDRDRRLLGGEELAVDAGHAIQRLHAVNVHPP